MEGVKEKGAKNGAHAHSVLYYLKEKDFSSALEKLALWGEEISLTKLQRKSLPETFPFPVSRITRKDRKIEPSPFLLLTITTFFYKIR